MDVPLDFDVRTACGSGRLIPDSFCGLITKDQPPATAGGSDTVRLARITILVELRE